MTKKVFDIEWVIRNYLPFFSEFGMTEQSLRDSYITWSSKRPKLAKDYVWFLFQNLLFETAKQSETQQELFKHHNTIYSEMLLFRRKIERKKANEILQLFLSNLIKKTIAETNFILKVQIISGHCCPYCDSLNGQITSVEETLKKMQLGSKNCSNLKGCNCTYAFVPK